MNPKGKKTISLTVSEELDLTGRELKKGINQLYRLFLGQISIKDADEELLHRVWLAVL